MSSLSLGADDDLNFLKRCKFFSCLDYKTLSSLCNVIVPRLVEEGKLIYDFNDISEEMYIVRSGEIVEEVQINGCSMGSALSQSKKTTLLAA
mmetsp:Transcript_32044/g.31342  ORF Transcript_32044/g.31342 Transcript_32044/m.31342 type:complete len:92 (+) Transcript_32044:208-483(+)